MTKSYFSPVSFLPDSATFLLADQWCDLESFSFMKIFFLSVPKSLDLFFIPDFRSESPPDSRRFFSRKKLLFDQLADSP